AFHFPPEVQQRLNLLCRGPDGTSRRPEQQARGHCQKWKRIIPTPPCELSPSSKRLPPGSQRQRAPAQVGKRGKQVMEFHNECLALNHRRAANTPAREIQMQRSHDVDPVAILEHPEIRADARIEINNLISAIALVTAAIDIHDA